MIIDCISDLHGYQPTLEGGDLLIVAGDCTASDEVDQWLEFLQWLSSQSYRKIVWIAGNHDGCIANFEKTKEIFLSPHFPLFRLSESIEYLCDSGTEFEGMKIWGSPWTKTFEGMNPKCKAFTCETEEELEEKWKLIPRDVNILVTHSPAFGCLDGIPMADGSVFHVGSKSLHHYVDVDWGILLHVCGHIHEGYGHNSESNEIFKINVVNASYVNEYYKPVNAPVRVIL